MYTQRIITYTYDEAPEGHGLNVDMSANVAGHPPKDGLRLWPCLKDCHCWWEIDIIHFVLMELIFLDFLLGKVNWIV